ncbi:MAG: UDP-N-acetylmuramoyl-L-alanine--D-glutamate ligase [Vampirovibrionales bacterium]|nr:UDP-N-acetylmuramoyl-L-alanine--D-glutamate ligase [Vampirovibrionales bacterium]
MSQAPESAFHRWQGRPVVILGLSKTGEAVARYLQAFGADVFLSERSEPGPDAAALRDRLQAFGCAVETGAHSEQCLSHAPLMIVSPGIPPHAEILQRAAAAGIEIISEVELAARENRLSRRLPIAAVTGSNGKTTTTTLIARLLADSGQRVVACGNIGLPMISCLGDNALEALVVELSSAQLAFSPTFQATVAAFMNLTPDHINWHGSLAAYEAAKRRLFTGEQVPTWAVVNADDPASLRWQADLPEQTLWFSRRDPHLGQKRAHAAFLTADGQFVFQRDDCPQPLGLSAADLKLKGAHNHENALAALSVAFLMHAAGTNTTGQTFARTCREFSGVAHRIEPAGEITRLHAGGVTRIACYNDSKATNTDAAIQALRAFSPQRTILIAGGRPKEEPLEGFVEAIQTHAAAVTLLGEAQPRFQRALNEAGYSAVYPCDTLERALDKAIALSQGEPILFSPACASFDQYQNFEHRGDVFKALIAQRQATPTPDAQPDRARPSCL